MCEFSFFPESKLKGTTTVIHFSSVADIPCPRFVPTHSFMLAVFKILFKIHLDGSKLPYHCELCADDEICDENYQGGWMQHALTFLLQQFRLYTIF